MNMKRILSLSVLLAASAATAGIMESIAVAGRVSGDAGHPVAGTAQDVEFRLYAAATNGAPVLWARLVPVAVKDDLSFYTDLADTAGTEIPGAAATRLRDAADICTRTSGSLWIGWTFPEAREAPRVELVKYPWAFASAKARTIGRAKCGSVVLNDLKVTNAGGAGENVIGSLETGKLVKPNGKGSKLRMVTHDDTSLAFTLTGGIGGFRRTDYGAVPEGTPVANDTLQAVRCKALPNLDSIVTKLTPCGLQTADDETEPAGFAQTLGSTGKKGETK